MNSITLKRNNAITYIFLMSFIDLVLVKFALGGKKGLEQIRFIYNLIVSTELMILMTALYLSLSAV